jgi:hypothetical protein
MRVATGEVDAILRSLGYMRPSLGKFWQPNKPMKLAGAFGARQLIGRGLAFFQPDSQIPP